MLHRTRSLARALRHSWQRRVLRNRKADGAGHLLLADPPVLHILYWTDRKDPLAFLDPLEDVLADRSLHVVCSFSWNMDPPAMIETLARVDAERRRRFPRHAIHYLACTPRQVEQIQARGISVVLCSNSALADESLYRPIPGAVKRYDAVYDARLSPFKRHQLAELIESLALVTTPSSNPLEADYSKDIRSRLAHARWCNPRRGDDCEPLTPSQVNQCLNEARVGLCLSAEEGAMYASVQYLLAGLPVVSTPSLGGRDLFFDPDYTAVVEPDPRAVADAVERMRDCPVPPEEIRERTLVRVHEHRRGLIDLVDRICAQEGKPRRFADDWPRVFCDKLAHMPAPLDRTDVLARIESAAGPG